MHCNLKTGIFPPDCNHTIKIYNLYIPALIHEVVLVFSMVCCYTRKPKKQTDEYINQFV